MEPNSEKVLAWIEEQDFAENLPLWKGWRETLTSHTRVKDDYSKGIVNGKPTCCLIYSMVLTATGERGEEERYFLDRNSDAVQVCKEAFALTAIGQVTTIINANDKEGLPFETIVAALDRKIGELDVKETP